MGHIQALLWGAIVRSERMLIKTHPYSYMKDKLCVPWCWHGHHLLWHQYALYCSECHGAYAGPAAGWAY